MLEHAMTFTESLAYLNKILDPEYEKTLEATHKLHAEGITDWKTIRKLIWTPDGKSKPGKAYIEKLDLNSTQMRPLKPPETKRHQEVAEARRKRRAKESLNEREAHLLMLADKKSKASDTKKKAFTKKARKTFSIWEREV